VRKVSSVKKDQGPKQHLRTLCSAWLSHQEQGVNRLAYMIDSLPDDVAKKVLERVVSDLKVQATVNIDRLNSEIKTIEGFL
jgi:hypothetical protein